MDERYETIRKLERKLEKAKKYHESFYNGNYPEGANDDSLIDAYLKVDALKREIVDEKRKLNIHEFQIVLVSSEGKSEKLWFDSYIDDYTEAWTEAVDFAIGKLRELNCKSIQSIKNC